MRPILHYEMFSSFRFLEFSSSDKHINRKIALEIELNFYLLLGKL